jgi:CNT family concentrative nucleoside transporter
MTRLLNLSGAESLSATGNIFLGQTESPLLIKAYLDKMTKSELMLVMVGGMATIAGGVLAIYIKFLGGSNPADQILFAKHLITASVMAAPGAVVMAKLLVPQTEEISTKVKVSKDKIGSNILEAITNGTTDGVKLAVNVGAMLLAFLAFISMLNFIFMKVGAWTDINDWVAAFTHGRFEAFSLEFVIGYTMAPLMWLIGVPTADITLVGQLLGEKIILNEFIAYTSLRDFMASGVFANEKSVIIATYILCGFANFSSIGIQLGGIGALAPGKRTTLSQLGFKALLGGAMASLLSATIIGMILG